LKDKIKEELADEVIYVLPLADTYEIDIKEIVSSKIETNNLKYPINKVKGSAKKYNEV
jgi:NTP pyrophosphatase (non-canonical NTP hydrolase)